MMGEEPEWEGNKNPYTGEGLWLNFCLVPVALDPISSHVGFVGVEAASFLEEGPNPTPRPHQI